jgi:hypothetical protein
VFLGLNDEEDGGVLVPSYSEYCAYCPARTEYMPIPYQGTLLDRFKKKAECVRNG